MLTALKIVFSLLMGLAGGAKLAGAKPLAAQFTEFGLPRTALYAVGALEVAAAIGVHVKPLAFFASTGAALLMVGAIRSHLKVGHPLSQAAPAALVLVLSLVHSGLTWPG